MVKMEVIPLTRPEMASLLEASMGDEFWFMFLRLQRKLGVG